MFTVKVPAARDKNTKCFLSGVCLNNTNAEAKVACPQKSISEIGENRRILYNPSSSNTTKAVSENYFPWQSVELTHHLTNHQVQQQLLDYP